MSGEGLIPACPVAMLEAAGESLQLLDYRGDFIAYLEQRRDNAEAIANRWPDFEREARAQRRQIDLIIGDVIAGMHEGAAGVRARRLAGNSSKETSDGT